MAFFDNCLFESSGYTDIDLEAEMADADISEDDIAEVDGTEESANEIYSGFCRDCFRLESAMYIADIGIEHAVIEGANASVLVENALTDLIEKAKKGILTVWAKVTKFFREIQAKIRGFINGCAIFIKKNSYESLEKKLANVSEDKTWSGYEFGAVTPSEFESQVKGTFNAISDLAVSSIDKIDDSINTDEVFRNTVHKVAKMFDYPNASAIDEIGELTAAISKQYYGEEVTDAKLKDIKPADLKRMYEFVKGANKVYLTITNAENEGKKQVKKAIDSLNKLKKDASEENSTKIHRGVKYNNYLIKITTKLSTTIVKCVNAELKQYGRLLRAIGLVDIKKEEKKEEKTEAPANNSGEPKTPNTESFSFFDRAYDTL